MLRSLLLLPVLALPLATIAQQPAPTIRQMFVQDQRERGVPYADNAHDMLPDAEAKKLPNVSDYDMGQHDLARRAQTFRLPHDGKLKTAEDFRDAAIIFQHSSIPDDFLLAHVLAVDAMAKGDTSGYVRDLTAVTLDRYLTWSGKKQIFGTQYNDARFAFSLQHPKDKTLEKDKNAIPASAQTLEPYNKTLLPDAIRADFCVPPQKQQTDYITAANAGKSVDLPNVQHCQ